MACLNGSFKVVKTLLSYNEVLKESFYKINSDGYIPLYHSCINDHNDIIKIFLIINFNLNKLNLFM